ncbi:hypothetical protein FB381_2848 [Nocardioides albertanoniae]|uniref:Uncharacterized protein n=1 Tax=Nocardioides albertanoniae TaxID=1175486 RepID=A0A543A8N3_9ACTN|nr:hypothetical protein [Nocardioides albertanoniae]TQL68947.1 hypothetical protein FB381_2848 [Nocardioides albertanoniae]
MHDPQVERPHDDPDATPERTGVGVLIGMVTVLLVVMAVMGLIAYVIL